MNEDLIEQFRKNILLLEKWRREAAVLREKLCGI